MGAPKGNQYAVGNKGGARKSYAQEKANYEMLEQIFLNEINKEEVQKKLASGKYSLKDVFVSKAFAGNERILSEIFRKLFPDKFDHTTKGEKIIPIYGGLSKHDSDQKDIPTKE